MKKFWDRNRNVIILLVAWRIVLFFIERAAPFVIPLHDGYNGPIPLSNHDGIHYLRIASSGYFGFSEAFFPLYPVMITGISAVTPFAPWISASFFSYLCFCAGLLLLYNMLYVREKAAAWRTIVLLVTFPTSFFFCAVYTEGLFFLLSILVFFFVGKKQWLWAGIFGALASATRLFGVILFVYAFMEYVSVQWKKRRIRDIAALCLMPLGLVGYMAYLFARSGDPILFFHVQPAFGANRSGGELILLPQVLWRYAKIIVTAFLKPTPASYFISVLEVGFTAFAYGVLWYGWKHRERLSLLVYGVLAITLPTLTGTLSSMPRYLLSVFPLFLILGKVENKKVQYGLISVFIILQIILSAMFLRGWFVA